MVVFIESSELREREMKKCNGSNGSSSAKVDRKTVEKNRRIHMKSLCFKLASLIPKEDKINPKDAISQHYHLDQAASYIKKLKARIEKLKQRKRDATRGESKNDTTTTTTTMADNCGVANETGLLPILEVRFQDPNLEVVLVTGLTKKFLFYKAIWVLEEEGASVVNANFSVVNDKIFYTVHSQAVSSRIGLDASRVSERLKELIHSSN